MIRSDAVRRGRCEVTGMLLDGDIVCVDVWMARWVRWVAVVADDPVSQPSSGLNSRFSARLL